MTTNVESFDDLFYTTELMNKTTFIFVDLTDN